MPDLQNFINGTFSEPSSTSHIDVTNPSTGQLICRVPDSDESVVGMALDAAKAAQPKWANMPAIERARFIREIAKEVRNRADELAKVIVEEQGKTLDLARVEVHFTADYLDYMAEWARRIEGEILSSDRPGETILLFQRPMGVVVGILPWNFPFFLIARKLAPALVTGNTIVIKPSEETPHNAAKFCEILAKVGLPPGVVNIVHGRGSTTGEFLCSSTVTDMVSFTGSVATGSKIMATASRNITKVNLELGGKAPAIVMRDADLSLAVKAIRMSRIINSGQVCNCAERVYVDSKIAEEFSESLASAMQATHYGDPLADESVEYGPLINAAGLQKVEKLVHSAVSQGATIVTGGKRAEQFARGNFYEPTVLRDCRQGMDIVQREIFGPVIPIVVIDDLEQAISYANDSEYGLTSSIYTRDLNTALKACQELRFGETYINRENFEAMQGFHSGWRKSGIGGADGKHGLYEYMQKQVVYLQRALD
ncbi:MAG TPA: aldehyde dehydrogenase [Terracidiphilus sp.]|nr:aldehyde dehydrogenase [Terracidiphilus sp.]